MSSRHDFVQSYLDAWNSRDANGVAQHFCADGLYCDMPSQQQLAGEDLIEHLVDHFSTDDLRYELIDDVLTNDNTVAFQYQVVPRDPRSGIAGWTGAEFIELEGDVAQQINDYYRVPAAPSTGAGIAPTP